MEMAEHPFNILYYSKYCNKCEKILHYITKSGLINELNCICIDKRVEKNGQVVVQLENGKQEALPPMIDRVPALLLVRSKYQVRYGDEIMEYYKKGVEKGKNEATGGNEGEPVAFEMNAFSSSFSAY